MRQRVAFLRTLLAGKPVLLLDEPFASLDAITRAEMQEWLARRARRAAAHGAPGHPRRRGGALSLRPGDRALGAPARVVAELAARRRRARPPRLETVDLAAFAASRERALAALLEAAAMRRWLAPLVVVAALIALWELAARWDLLADALGIEPFLVPAPSDVAESLWNDRELLADNAWVTLAGGRARLRASPPSSASSFAVVLHLSDILRRAFYPLLIASQTVPVIAIAPILVVWLGFGIGPKLVIIALVCFFPITVNTLDGLRSVDPELPRMMRTLDASRAQILRRVEIPSALPFLFSGAQDRRRDLGHRRRLRRVVGRRRGPRPPDPRRPGPAADRARVRRGRRPLGDRDRAVRAAGAARAPASPGGAPGAVGSS